MQYHHGLLVENNDKSSKLTLDNFVRLISNVWYILENLMGDFTQRRCVKLQLLKFDLSGRTV